MERESRVCLHNDKLEGRYANYFKVGHNEYEFVIDFGQFYEGTEEAELYTRIVTTPAYAKNLLETLRESMAQYEKTFAATKGEYEGPGNEDSKKDRSSV